MKSIYTHIALILLISCSGNETSLKQREFKTNHSEHINDTLLFESKIIQTEPDIFNTPININEVKNLDFVDFTSGISPKSSLNEVCATDTGYYGSYFLINKSNKNIEQPYFAKLIVHIPEKPKIWRADSKTEQFKRLTLYTNDIVVWDSIFIGLDSTNLFNSFNRYTFTEDNGSVIFNLHTYWVRFKFNNSSITEIDIEKICK